MSERGERPAHTARPFVEAVITGDWHLSDCPPMFRENEPDWYAAMLRPINQIKTLQNKYKCPILFTGDLFDKAKSSPELVNWTLRHIPILYGISGNHDQVHHRYEDLDKSSYGTIVEAGRIIDLKPGVPHPVSDRLMVHGYPFGTPIKFTASHMIDGMNVALIHAYCWKKGKSFPGAPEDKHVNEWAKRLRGFDVAFFGDNHNAFYSDHKPLQIANTGCIMRRRADESEYRSRVALLWSDGEISEEDLDCSNDVYLERVKEEVKPAQVDPERLIRAFNRLNTQTCKIDFIAVVNEIMEAAAIRKEVREYVAEALDGGE